LGAMLSFFEERARTRLGSSLSRQHSGLLNPGFIEVLYRLGVEGHDRTIWLWIGNENGNHGSGQGDDFVDQGGAADAYSIANLELRILSVLPQGRDEPCYVHPFAFDGPMLCLKLGLQFRVDLVLGSKSWVTSDEYVQIKVKNLE